MDQMNTLQMENDYKVKDLSLAEWGRKEIEIAENNHTLISIDLADSGVVKRNKEFLKGLIKDVDFLFVNENEAKEFTGLQEEEAVKMLGNKVKIAVLKLGEKGLLIYHNNELVKIDPFQVNVVDTTGAGDSYAAGLLYGYCQGWNLEKAGKLGSLFASKVI